MNGLDQNAKFFMQHTKCQIKSYFCIKNFLCTKTEILFLNFCLQIDSFLTKSHKSKFFERHPMKSSFVTESFCSVNFKQLNHPNHHLSNQTL